MQILLTLFLVGHRAVHTALWALPYTDATHDMPFDSAQSWLLGRRPAAAAVLAGVATAGFIIAAIGLTTREDRWPAAMSTSAAATRFERRCVYASPSCNKVLGITHRKGFWMG